MVPKGLSNMYQKASILKEVPVSYATETVPHYNFIDPWARLELKESKVVAIDFDETISDNPAAWLTVMSVLERAGYHVVVCTWRTPSSYPEDLEFLVDKGYKVYYTSFRCKMAYMKEQGVDVAIWIDDNPFAILNDLS
jgi:hypothetical protein